MTYEQFCYWLSGLLETMKDDTKWDKLIRQKLNDTLVKESKGIEISSREKQIMDFYDSDDSWEPVFPVGGWTWRPDEIQATRSWIPADLPLLEAEDCCRCQARTYTLTKSYWPKWVSGMNPIDLQPINQSLPTYEPNLLEDVSWWDGHGKMSIWDDFSVLTIPANRIQGIHTWDRGESYISREEACDTTLTTTGISL